MQLLISVGMTIKAGYAVIYVTGYTLVMLIRIRLIVFMAINAAEDRVVGRVGMAIGAGVPLPVVLS